jgi:hypothetical protein
MAKDGRSNRISHEHGMKYASNMQEMCKQIDAICKKYAQKMQEKMQEK